jgi:DNA invertase Pin-like site-specific DNA recombinase
MTPYIAYYRVSTDRQGRSGLGLEAQQQAVTTFIQGRGDLVASYTEIESGKRNDRPQLEAALAACKKEKAKLVIAKLDRLARNVYFISGLLESGVDFLAVDMPEANRLTIHILAAVAEHEREMISQRTKVALAAAKARGTKFGSPRPEIGSAKGNAVICARAAALAVKLQPIIAGIQAEGITTLRGIARALNQRGIPTAQGGQWQAIQVGRLLRRLLSKDSSNTESVTLEDEV